MDQVVAALGERLDHRGEARHADLEARVEGDVDLGDRAAGGGRRCGSVPITSTSKPGTPRSRIRSSVWVTPCIAADGVGDQRDAPRLALAVARACAFSRPRKAAAGAYGIAGMQASNRPRRRAAA